MNRTANAGLALPDLDTSRWDQVLNANFALLDGLAPVGWLAVAPAESPSTSLNVAVAPGAFRNSARALIAYAGGNVALPASATTYLWLTDAGAVATGTAWPGSGPYLPLATVATGAAAVASVADARLALAVVGAPAPAPASSSYLVLAADANLANERVVAGTANQVILADGGPNGALTFSLPQSIAATSSPTFAAVAVAGNPATALQLAPKQYVDAGDATATAAATSANGNANNRVLKAGDAMTGPLAMAGLTMVVRTVSAATTILATDGLLRVDCSGGAVTVTLPAPSSVGNLCVRVKKVDATANALTIASATPIDGQSSVAVGSAYGSRTLIGDAASNTWNVC